MEDEWDQTYLSGGGWDGVREHGMRDECSKFGPVSRLRPRRMPGSLPFWTRRRPQGLWLMDK